MAPLRPLNPAMAATGRPPIMEALRWRAEAPPPADLPLLNFSQAAPAEAPPLPLRREIARIAMDEPEAHLYGPDLGLPALRAEIAAEWSRAYGGAVRDAQVAITSGCNQAFTAALATLAGAGDEVILPVPWYFNHKMALDMAGIGTVPLKTRAGLIPDAEDARALITDRTRAIVLVTPNNPGGAEYPASAVRAFFDLCREKGLALILDETYRDFDSRDGAVHDLFQDPDWDDTLIQMYSFSKAYRLTGHRIGAMTASEARLAEVEKYIDTVTICPNQIGQRAALWGMRNLRDWLAEQRAEILARRDAVAAEMQRLPGWELLGLGAYFAYVRHPFDMASDTLCRRLVTEAGVLILPATMFRPEDDRDAAKEVRIAFANADADGIAQLFDRLAGFKA